MYRKRAHSALNCVTITQDRDIQASQTTIGADDSEFTVSHGFSSWPAAAVCAMERKDG